MRRQDFILTAREVVLVCLLLIGSAQCSQDAAQFECDRMQKELEHIQEAAERERRAQVMTQIKEEKLSRLLKEQEKARREFDEQVARQKEQEAKILAEKQKKKEEVLKFREQKELEKRKKKEQELRQHKEELESLKESLQVREPKLAAYLLQHSKQRIEHRYAQLDQKKEQLREKQAAKIKSEEDKQQRLDKLRETVKVHVEE